MAGTTSPNIMSAGRAGLALGLVSGGFALIAVEVLLPQFFETPLQVLGVVLLWVLLALICSLLVGLVRPQSVIAGCGAFLAAILVLLFGKLLLPSSLVVPFVAAIVGATFVGLALRNRTEISLNKFGLVGLVLVLIAAILPLLMPREKAIGTRLVVVGLDAGTWTVLDELFGQGDLPNIRQMVDNGVAGTLLSREPTLSPRVWTSIATGKEPAKHGIQDFFSTQNRDLKAARFWEILLRFDYSVSLFRWLVTWPPDPVGAFNVPGWMARDASTIPPELSFIKEVERKFQNDVKASLSVGEALRWSVLYLRSGVRFDTCMKALSLASKQWVGKQPWEASYATKRTIHDLLNMDVFLALQGRHRPDVSAVVFYGSDNLAHKVWKYRYPEEFGLDPEKAVIGEFLDNYYREVDRFLGELRTLVGERTTIVLVSDHGYGSSEGGTGLPEKQIVLKPRMVNILEFLELESPDEATVASVSTRGYITFKGDAADREGRFEQAMKTLGAVRIAGTDSPVFVLTRMESGQLEVAITEGEDDLEEGTPLEVLGRSLVLADLVEVEQRAGGHSVKGILIAQGPDLRKRVSLPDSNLVDIAPTLLYLLGVPVAEDMDGRILQEMIDPEFLARNPPEWVSSYDDLVLQLRESGWEEGDEETLKKELEALGYLN